MIASRYRANAPDRRTALIEGYASRFGLEDQSRDVVRAGAFSKSLKSQDVPMLLQHRTRARIGRWTRIFEDGRGLFVRGVVESKFVRRLIADGLSGLSIGFRPQVWTPRTDGGRLLIQVELVEISLVARPMLDQARFELV